MERQIETHTETGLDEERHFETHRDGGRNRLRHIRRPKRQGETD